MASNPGTFHINLPTPQDLVEASRSGDSDQDEGSADRIPSGDPS